MKKKPEVKELKEWLDKNSAVELAHKLGYKNTTTVVYSWVYRNNIPSWQLDRVLEIIRSKKETKNVVRKGD